MKLIMVSARFSFGSQCNPKTTCQGLGRGSSVARKNTASGVHKLKAGKLDFSLNG